MRIPCCLLLMCSAARMFGVTMEFQSSTNQTALLELYTSEGCSSCPPAESWLSQLKTQPKLWKEFVPVAFHVDYWDYLGWNDSFASARFSERQRDYAATWKSRSVYTPGFVLDGKEWRGWGGRDSAPKASAKPAGVFTATSTNGTQWTLRFQPAATAPGKIQFHAALLGFDLTTDVKAGENRGRKLAHDFVVLALTAAPANKSGEILEAVLTLTLSTKLAPKRLGFAAWVTSAAAAPPLQTVGGWLEPKTKWP